MRTGTTKRFDGALLAAVVATFANGTLAGAAESTRGPSRFVLAPHVEHYFRFSEGYGSRWLWLKADGTYIGIDHGDTNIAITSDRGRWEVEGPRLVLAAQIRVRDIETPEFDVLVEEPCGVELLPSLRRWIAAVAADPARAAASSGEFSAFREGGTHFRCGAMVMLNGKVGGAPMLDRMVHVIDSYLAEPADRHRFVFDAYAYHGRTFLVPVDPGPSKSWIGLVQVKSELDPDVGGDPQLVYLDATKDIFEQIDACDFPLASARCDDLSAAMVDTLVRWFPSLRSR